MTGRISRRGPAFVVLATAIALAGCGKKQTAASNVVEMRDMEVVDGTANDDMTDLDAVRTNGIGAGTAVVNSAAPAAAKPGADKAPADAESVPTE